MLSLLFRLGTALILLATPAAVLSQSKQIVYDNTLTNSNHYVSEPREFGDELILTNTARTLTDIWFYYYGEFTPDGDETFKVRIYANEKQYDLFRKEPTRVLYESGWIPLNRGYISQHLPGFSAPLENLVTFTIETRGLAAHEKVGLLLYGPIGVGRSFNELWRRNESGHWEAVIYSFPQATIKANVALRLAAVESVRLGQIRAGENQLNFNISGLTGTRYVVESSTNLVNWIPLESRNVTGLLSSYSRSLTREERESRFFRIRQNP
jgi:hypothetical protein